MKVKIDESSIIMETKLVSFKDFAAWNGGNTIKVSIMHPLTLSCGECFVKTSYAELRKAMILSGYTIVEAAKFHGTTFIFQVSKLF